MIYLDNAATTKIKREVVNAMLPYLNEKYGNPSGLYNLSKQAKTVLNTARENIAKSINTNPENIFFTSGGTESDNWVLNNKSVQNGHIITSDIEHHAILNKCGSFTDREVYYAGVDRWGRVNPLEIEDNIKDNTTLISIMFANNEIGTIEPVKEIGKIAKEHNIEFHTDAVQAYCHVPIDVEAMNIDFLSASAHKFHGPKGVGFLYIRNPENIKSFIYGGGQEKGKRAGTENVAGIAGLNQAVCEMMVNFDERMKYETKLREYLIERVLNEIPYTRLNGHRTKRLPGNANFTIAGVDGTSLVVLMDNDGVCLSAGSACSFDSEYPSHVISAIGIPKQYIFGTIRITLCADNTKEEIDYTVEKLKENVTKLRKNSNIR